MKKTLIAPSILSADFSNLTAAFADIEKSGADWVHLDVMDGSFVPPITFGAKMASDLRPLSKLPFDVHLMTRNPENLIAPFAEAGADYITFHIEAAVHAHRIVQTIHQLGKKAGISIVPSTPVSAVECLLPFLDLVLVMTVNPGYGGQQCIAECFTKLRDLARLRREKNLAFLLSADGGINEGTAKTAVEAGCDVLIAGSAFFNADDKAALVEKLRGNA
jgi:ribulose-phosphate 3-epimerase